MTTWKIGIISGAVVLSSVILAFGIHKSAELLQESWACENLREALGQDKSAIAFLLAKNLDKVIYKVGPDKYEIDDIASYKLSETLAELSNIVAKKEGLNNPPTAILIETQKAKPGRLIDAFQSLYGRRLQDCRGK